MSSGSPSSSPDGPHLVLEQEAERFDEIEVHVFGEAADVVVRLDLGGVAGARLDDVGVERALHEEPGDASTSFGAELLGRLLEDADERLADGLALLLRVGHAGQDRQEPVGRLHVDEVDVELAQERLFDLLRFTGPQQAGVDEDTGQLVAHRLVDQRRRHRGVDPARQAADHRAVAHLGLDGFDGLFDDRQAGPRGPGVAHVVEEGFEDLHAPVGVDHLGVELHAVDRPVGVFERRHRRGRRGRGLEAGGSQDDRVAVAHPHFLLDRQVGEQQRRVDQLEFGAAVLPRPGAADLAAQLLGDELAAVADAEQRHAGVVDRRVDRRRTVHVHRGRAAGEDDPLRLPGQHLRRPACRAARSRSRRWPPARGGRSAGRTALRSRRRGLCQRHRASARGSPTCPSRCPGCAGGTCPPS